MFLFERKSKLEKFMRKHGLNQQELVKVSGVSRSTISRLCQNGFEPNTRTGRKIIKALKEYDESVQYEDFWGA
jgi:predicted transcriptional regulator